MNNNHENLLYNIRGPIVCETCFKEYKILDVAKMLIQKIKNSEDYYKYLEYVEDRPFNDKRYYISNNKLKELGWTQKMNFNKGLDLLITYIEICKLNQNNLKMDNIP